MQLKWKYPRIASFARIRVIALTKIKLPDKFYVTNFANFFCSDFADGNGEYIVKKVATNECGCFDLTESSQIPESIFVKTEDKCICDQSLNDLYTSTITGSRCDCQDDSVQLDESPFCQKCSDEIFQSAENHYQVLHDGVKSNSCKCYNFNDSPTEIPETLFSKTGTSCECDMHKNDKYTGTILNEKCECTPDAVEIDSSPYCKACTEFTDGGNYEVVAKMDNICSCLDDGGKTITHSYFSKYDDFPCKCKCTNCDETGAIAAYSCKCEESSDGNYYKGLIF